MPRRWLQPCDGRATCMTPSLQPGERGVQQLWGVLCGVDRVQQDDRHAAAISARYAYEAAAGRVCVAGLEADRSGVAHPDQRVVAVQVQPTALDREAEVHLAAARDPADSRLGHRQAGQDREVARAGAVAVLEAVRRREVRALEAPASGAL